MKPQELLDILAVSAKLKTNTRHCYTQADRKESIADHSYRISLMAMLLASEKDFQDYDMNKVIRMCLIHDLGEAFTGDIPSFDKSTEDEDAEKKILTDWVSGFPEPQRSEWLMLYSEMDALETNEAKLYKALDKLEAVISHDESDISTWLPLEYDLQLTYADKQVRFSEYLTRLKEALDDVTRKKIKNAAAEV